MPRPQNPTRPTAPHPLHAKPPDRPPRTPLASPPAAVPSHRAPGKDTAPAPASTSARTGGRRRHLETAATPRISPPPTPALAAHWLPAPEARGACRESWSSESRPPLWADRGTARKNYYSQRAPRLRSSRKDRKALFSAGLGRGRRVPRRMEEKPPTGIKPYLDKLTLGVTRILGEWR